MISNKFWIQIYPGSDQIYSEAFRKTSSIFFDANLLRINPIQFDLIRTNSNQVFNPNQSELGSDLFRGISKSVSEWLFQSSLMQIG